MYANPQRNSCCQRSYNCVLKDAMFTDVNKFSVNKNQG